MRMIVVALIGGVALGFVVGQLLADPIRNAVSSPSYQTAAIAGTAAFLGTLWGWVGSRIFRSRARD